MSLLRSAFWIVLFLFFTLCFLVVFEYGIHDFQDGFKKESERVKTYVMHFNDKPAKPTDKPKK